MVKKRKRATRRFDELEDLKVNLYRNIYSGKWATIKPKALTKEDPRWIPHYKNLSRTLIRAKERVASYKEHRTGKLI